MREKEEWKCATMECGGQCALMDGMTLLLILLVVNCNLDTQTQVSEFSPLKVLLASHSSLPATIGVPLKDYEWENSLSLFNNTACNETHSTLFQCISEDNIGVYDCGENNTARVVCEMPNPDVTTSS